ncbi:MAG: hypothetical protein ACLQJ0_23050 [Steroidobacteraceae bacterium]
MSRLVPFDCREIDHYAIGGTIRQAGGHDGDHLGVEEQHSPPQ